MSWVAGVDGCKGGWFVVLRETSQGRFRLRTAGTFLAVLELDEAPSVVCIDVPIGLLDGAAPGGRDCDRAVRKLLGPLRGRSVFSPPARATLKASSYEEAVRLNRASSSHGMGISRQCWGILEKIGEVDSLMSPRHQTRVLEAHPEASFYELNGRRPVEPTKKSTEGRRHRIALLERRWGMALGEAIDSNRNGRVARDDVVDAMAACWTAERFHRGEAIRVPSRPPIDGRGLRMEIVR